MDPSFSVLQESKYYDTCSPHKKSNKTASILIAVFVTVGGLLLLGALVYVIMTRRGKQQQLATSPSRQEIMLEERSLEGSHAKSMAGSSIGSSMGGSIGSAMGGSIGSAMGSTMGSPTGSPMGSVRSGKSLLGSPSGSEGSPGKPKRVKRTRSSSTFVYGNVPKATHKL